MTNEKLYIVITNKAPSGSGDGDDEKKDKESSLTKYAKHEFMHLIKQTAKQAVNLGVSQIGNLTGDYAKQENAQNAVDVVGGISSIGMAAFAGFKATGGNPIGAVIGAGIGLISSTLGWASNVQQQSIQARKQNQEIEQLRIRAGLSTYNNGGRTGY